MKNSFFLIPLFTSVFFFLSFPTASSAQIPFRPPFKKEPVYDLGTIYFMQKSNSKILKLVEGKTIFYSTDKTEKVHNSGQVTRIRKDSIYIDHKGYLFSDFTSIGINFAVDYRKADSASWKVYFPPDQAYLTPVNHSRFEHKLNDTLRIEKKALIKTRFIKNTAAFNHNNFKINITDIFILKAAISYEYRFTKKLSWELETGYRFRGQTDPPAFFRTFQIGQYAGPSIITGPKYFPGSGRMYLGAMMQADYLEMHQARSSFYNYHYEQLQDQYRFDLGLSLRVGILTRMGKDGVVDFYTGLGLQYISIHGLVYGRYLYSDSDQIMFYHPDQSPDIDNYTIWWPIVHLGINIGFGF